MAKKRNRVKRHQKKQNYEDQNYMSHLAAKLPKEAQDRLKNIKSVLDNFQKKIISKFDKYIMGIALLPPAKYPLDASTPHPTVQPHLVPQVGIYPQPAPKEAPSPDDINVLVLVDDSDSKKIMKSELKSKLSTIISGIAKDVDKNLKPQTIILTELWHNCYDAKYDLLQTIAMAAPVYDTGMLSAIKIAEVHKSMVLKKFEKYIVSYVLAGSLVQGKATSTSDIDVWVVIDDTDVKKMTRAELKDKLRAIIIGMGIEASDITGIRNKLNIQVYILTDFWDSLKEANPVIFTLLRDGVPFYDRGIFMPWKQLLKMGKIKPSPEAIDIFMNTGENVLRRVKLKLKEIGMEDIYYAILTPSQAALMLLGMPPPAPRETPDLMREIFVHKEKLLEEKYIKILNRQINIRKDIEHGTKKELTGKEIDETLKDAEDYLKRIKELFKEIEKVKNEKNVLHIYDTTITVIRDVLRMEGVEEMPEGKILHQFEKKLIHSGKVPAKLLRSLKTIEKAKKDYEAGKLTKPEIHKVKIESNSLTRELVEYMQRKRGRELERAKIRVKHGERFGEVLLLDDTAFIIHDIDNETGEISKAPLNSDGSLGTVQKSSLEELERGLASAKIPKRVFIKQPIFEDLKNLFGKDVEVLINY